MPKTRTDVPDKMLVAILHRCNNRCCVCQTPFIVIHHIDENPSNNDPDNLAPLCPNCHSQGHSKSKMTTNLNAERIKKLRDIWYSYCDQRRETQTTAPNAVLKMTNFVEFVEANFGLPPRSWAKTFALIHPDYKDMKKHEMIQRLFVTSNRDDLITYLETVKGLYANPMKKTVVEQKFINVCQSFGIDFADLI